MEEFKRAHQKMFSNSQRNQIITESNNEQVKYIENYIFYIIFIYQFQDQSTYQSLLSINIIYFVV